MEQSMIKDSKNLMMDMRKINKMIEEWFDIPRVILRKLEEDVGIKFIEMYRIKNHSMCCGAGGGVRAGYPDFSLRTASLRCDEANAVGADILTTECPFCWRNLTDANDLYNHGENNKLILVPHEDERLLGAAIVSSRDNNELVIKIIKEILQEFIDSYSPDYDQEKILHEDMEKIIQDVLRTKIIHSPIIRNVLSWLINVPLTFLLIFVSINVTLLIYAAFNLTQYFNWDQLFSRFFLSLILISTANIVILFLFPN
ncbi:unnamed protein product, partial [marine sediment metagenome]